MAKINMETILQSLNLGRILLIIGLVYWFLQSASWFLKKQNAKKVMRTAQQGNASWQYDLSLLYYNGKGLSEDHTKSKYWYEKSAQQGHLPSKLMVKIFSDTHT